MKPDDKLYLNYILDCFDLIEQCTAIGKTDFMSNKIYQAAALRGLQTLAESTQRLSEALKKAHPDVPWRQIARFRNIVVHNYLTTDLDIVWNIIEHDLPDLKPKIQAMLQSLGGTP